MRDLISRQALCDDLREHKVHPVPISSDESEVKGYNDGIDLAISVIAEFPSAEPERKWTPVTEALPEICEEDVRGNVTLSKEVWSCQKYGDGFYWQSIDIYSTNNGGGWISEVHHDDPADCCKVVAWMPLIEPWRGEDEDAE